MGERVPSTFSVNDRTYTVGTGPVVVICIDGSEPEYHHAAMLAGRMPWLSAVLDGRGQAWPACCAMPALTNPNNVSIATGQPAAVHGISGNYILDPETGSEVLMNDPRFLRAPTVFAAANASGLDVAVVTAKDKLRRLLGAGLVDQGPALDGAPGLVMPQRRGICFSAEKADQATEEANGIGSLLDLIDMPLPDVYSAELSEFVLAAGVKLLTIRHIDLLYLSLTDYIQHKHAPGTDQANAFYAMVDQYARYLDELGATIVLTADHGMSGKSDGHGQPRVVFVEEEIRKMIGSGPDDESDDIRVILPITDPYTVHHGALGSFASAYLPRHCDRAAVIEKLRTLDGVETVCDRRTAQERFALPADRIGDVVVLAETGTALGRFPAWHDLSGLDTPLRSHGALGELSVPFIINRPLPEPERFEAMNGKSASVHNFDAFWIATTYLSTHTTDRPGK